MHKNELSTEELDQVTGGDFSLGPFNFYYSKGSGAIGVSVGDAGVYIGPNGAGWNVGDKYGQIKFH